MSESKESQEAVHAILSTDDAARFLGLSTRTLEAMRMRGTGPQFFRISARCVRYKQDDLLSWLNSKIRTSTANVG